jgi:hypothetical protein
MLTCTQLKPVAHAKEVASGVVNEILRCLPNNLASSLLPFFFFEKGWAILFPSASSYANFHTLSNDRP